MLAHPRMELCLPIPFPSMPLIPPLSPPFFFFTHSSSPPLPLPFPAHFSSLHFFPIILITSSNSDADSN